MPPKDDTLLTLRTLLREFALDRDWQKFHTPKNLAVSVAIEAGELLEAFQWLESGALAELQQLPASRLESVRNEIADVLLYLIRLADVLDIDLESAAMDKLNKNAAKYPVLRVRGDPRKYDEY
jgi:NTP pyrophosphatase (non-canonical NTP hydrolase)